VLRVVARAALQRDDDHQRDTEHQGAGGGPDDERRDGRTREGEATGVVRASGGGAVSGDHGQRGGRHVAGGEAGRGQRVGATRRGGQRDGDASGTVGVGGLDERGGLDGGQRDATLAGDGEADVLAGDERTVDDGDVDGATSGDGALHRDVGRRDVSLGSGRTSEYAGDHEQSCGDDFLHGFP